MKTKTVELTEAEIEMIRDDIESTLEYEHSCASKTWHPPETREGFINSVRTAESILEKLK